jgi:hypothetical protein
MNTLAWLLVNVVWPMLGPILKAKWGHEVWFMEADSAFAAGKKAKTPEEKQDASAKIQQAIRRRR